MAVRQQEPGGGKLVPVPVGLCPVYFYDDRWPGLSPIWYLASACCQKGFNALFIRGVNAITCVCLDGRNRGHWMLYDGLHVAQSRIIEKYENLDPQRYD